MSNASDVSLDAFAVTFPAAVEEEFSAAYGSGHWENIKRALAKPYVIALLVYRESGCVAPRLVMA